MANQGYTVKFTGQFDTSQITKGIQDIKKQVTNANISEELKKQLQDAFSKVEVNLPKLDKFIGKDNFSIKELQQYQKLILEIQKDMSKFNDIVEKVDFKDFISQNDTNKLKQFDDQIQKVEEKITSLRKEMMDAFSQKSGLSIQSNTMQKAIEDLFSVDPDRVKDKFAEIKNEAIQQSEKAQEDIQNALLNRSKKFEKNKDVIDFLYGESSKVTINRNFGGPAVQALQQAKMAIQDLASGKEVEDFSEKLQRLFELVSQTGEFEGAFDNPNGEQSTFSGLKVDISEILSQLEKLEPHLEEVIEISKEKLTFINEAEAEKIGLVAEKTKFLNEILNLLVESQILTKKQVESLTKELLKQSEAVAEGSKQLEKEKTRAEALSATFGGLANRITNSISALTVFNKSIQIVHRAIDSVKELDAAFTQIAIVSEQSGEQAWKLFDNFNKLAKQYSITTKDLTEGAKLFYQQGLSAADTMKMVEASTVSAALGEVTMTEAANTLTAAIQGYNESASVAMDYTDKIAMVGAVSAADFNELSAAMEKTASSAYTAGIDFDHLLGYLGKMIEVTREAPANLGTAMKTIIARFEDMKKDPMAILEDGVSANKVEAALATIGIALRDSEGEFRALQDVITELGMKWNSLTRNQQAYIATVAAGSRQQSRFLAMMNDFDRTMDLIIESQNSAGAAAKQYATYQDSIAAAQARLTASWENFYSKIVDNGAIKFAINGLSSLVDVLSKIPPSITAIGASIGALELQGFIRGSGAKNLLETIFGKFVTKEDGSVKQISDNIVKTLFNGIKKSIKKQSEEFDLFNKGEKGLLSVFLNNYEKESQRFESISQKTGKSLISLKDKFGEFKVGIKDAGKALFNFLLDPVTLSIIGATVAITLIIKGLNKLSNITNDAAKKIQKLNEELSDSKEDLKNKKELIERYEELTRKINRNASEQEELNNLIQELGEQYEDVFIYMDEYGNWQLSNKEKILDTNKALEEQIKLKQKQIIQAKEEFLNKPSFQITEENAQTAGYSSSQAKEIMNAIENEQLAKNARAQVDSIITTVGDYQSALNAMESIRTILSEYFSMDLKLPIPEIQVEGEDYEFQEQVYEYLGKLIEIWENATTTWTEFKKKEEQNFEIELWDVDFKRDAKYNGMVVYFKEVLKALPSEEFDNIGKEMIASFENMVKTITNPDDIVKMQEFLEDYAEGSFNSEKLYDKAVEAGINVTSKFYQGLELGLQEREAQLRSQTINAINDIFGGAYLSTDYYDNVKLTPQQAQRQVDLASFITNNDIKEEAQAEMLSSLSSYADELANFQEKAIKDGSIKGYEDGYKEVEKKLKENFGENSENLAIFSKWGKAVGDETADEIYKAIENRLTESKGNFLTAKDILGKESQESLSDEEYSFLKSQNESIDSYISINNEGEKFLSTLGKIIVLEKERSDYTDIIRMKIEENENINARIEEQNNKISELQQKQINNRKRENSLLKEQLQKLEEIRKITTTATAMSDNISYADSYYEIIDTIKTAEEEAEKANGRIKRSTAESLIAMNREYALYLKLRESGEGAYYELTEDNAKKMRQIAINNYNKDLNLEKQKLDDRITILKGELEIFQEVADGESDLSYQEYQEKVKNLNKILEGDIEEANQELITEQDKYNKSLTMASTYATQYQDIIGASLDNLGAKADALHNSLATVQSDNYIPYNGGSTANSSNKTSITPQKAEKGQAEEKGAELVKRAAAEEEERKKMGAKRLDAERAALKEQAKQEDARIAALKKENSEDHEKQTKAEQAAMQADAAIQVERINNEIAILEATKEQLKPLAPDLEDVKGSGGKTADELKKLNDVVKDLNDALEDLDDLLVDINRDLNDINVDYNPFTDLFEAWEKEWDYYYNIKRLIQQIQDQGKYIDGIISADYTSADQKIAAEQAKVGKLLAAMAANDTYIESLRTGMSQTALELMDEFGEYYKINPDTGQIYQHDTSLNEINNTINQRRQEIYELQKLQNEKENDLSLENAKLDALEKEKSAYEDILSTVESQLDSLRDDDDIIANVSQLESEQANIKAKITLTDESIDVLKGVVRNIEDEIQEIEIDVTLKEQSVSKLEEYVDKMEDKVSEYEEYWENLNSTIAEQQELLQSITEEYNKYIDTAISTEQDLYNAIVENYQNEINQKKKQYDELKKLDNDYLASVKDSIDEERKARDDSNKQKSYQQSLQRAQLLQQDTSGAYRAELAQLNKDIEQQRQDLYDDLVDKQVEALEKEIEKRHELYDKEVTALEERLAYMQENAILLWETVNNIVAEGAENMMSILENTTAYINSNELAKEKQRKQWEYNVKKTFDGVQNKTIDMLNDLIDAGNEYIKDKLPEVGTAVDNYTEVYQDAAHVITNYNELLQNNMWSLFGGTGNEGMFQTILNSFMTTWNNTTNILTGYSESWQGIVEGLRSATEGNIEALRNMNNQGGSIKELDKALRDSARELYEDFLEERRRYRDELNGLIDTIRVEITDAIKAAADAIRSAANSLQTNPSKNNGGTTTSTGGNQPAQSTTQPTTTTTTTTGTKTRYKIQVQGGYLAADGTVHTIKETYGGYNSAAAAIEAVRKDLARRREQQKWQNYWHNDLIPIAYAKGGLADYTGPAWLDGTKSQPEAVLNPKQTRLFTSMVSSLEKASNNSNINSPLGSSYNIGDINTTIQVDKLDNQTDINRLARQVEDKIVKDIRNRIPVSVTKGV